MVSWDQAGGAPDRGSRILLRTGACLLLTGACATQTPPPAPAVAPVPDTVFVVDTMIVETTVTDQSATRTLEQEVSALQLRLLERDAQIEELQRRLDEAIQEVVRTMAKLQSQATRAEAASGIAEAEIALEQVETAQGGASSADIRQARGLLASSTEEFNNQNFGGSLYLANQVRAIVRVIQGRAAGATRPDEQQFAVPVSLATTTRSNVRGGPGMGFNVLFTLEAGTPVTGRAYTEEWIRVETGDGRSGWIFHTLVRRPE